MRQWLPSTVAAVVERDDDPVAGPAYTGRPRLGQDLHAAPAEDVLEDRGGVGVLAGQHPVARGHERDLRPERLVGDGELGAGHAGADHDQRARAARSGRRPAPRSGSARRRASPSGSIRGCAPVATSTASALEPLRRPVGDPWRPPRARRPASRSAVRAQRTARPLEPAPRCRADWACASALDPRVDRCRGRRRRRPRRARRRTATPSAGCSSTSRRSSPRRWRSGSCCGTQSVSTADAPPRPSRSTTVTSAPSWAATSAAS